MENIDLDLELKPELCPREHNVTDSAWDISRRRDHHWGRKGTASSMSPKGWPPAVREGCAVPSSCTAAADVSQVLEENWAFRGSGTGSSVLEANPQYIFHCLSQYFAVWLRGFYCHRKGCLMVQSRQASGLRPAACPYAPVAFYPWF